MSELKQDQPNPLSALKASQFYQVAGLFVLLLTVDLSVQLVYKTAETIYPHSAGFDLAVLLRPMIWLGLGLSLLQLWIWTSILKRTHLSVAYPVSSLAYPLTMLMGLLVFHERLSPEVWLGASLVVAGVSVIGFVSRNNSH